MVEMSPKLQCPICGHIFNSKEVLTSKRKLVLQKLRIHAYRFNELKRATELDSSSLAYILEHLQNDGVIQRIEVSKQHILYSPKEV